MTTPPDEFGQLRKLLKLKQYECPPPRYFGEFSDHVITRLREEAADTVQARVWREAPWLQRFFQFLETNSLAAGAFATSICALMIGGIVYSEFSDRAPALVNNGEGDQMLAQQRTSSSSFLGDDLVNTSASISSNGAFGALVSPGMATLGAGVSVKPVSLNLGFNQ